MISVLYFHLLCYAAVLLHLNLPIMLNIMLKNKNCGKNIILFIYKFAWTIHYI